MFGQKATRSNETLCEERYGARSLKPCTLRILSQRNALRYVSGGCSKQSYTHKGLCACVCKAPVGCVGARAQHSGRMTPCRPIVTTSPALTPRGDHSSLDVNACRQVNMTSCARLARTGTTMYLFLFWAFVQAEASGVATSTCLVPRKA